MNASIITLQMNLLAQLCIYLPSPLMIDPVHMKEPDIPQICSHLPSLLPLKNCVSNLTNPYDYPYILPSNDRNTLHVMKKYVPSQGSVQRGFCCRKHGKKDTTKIQSSIDQHALIRTKHFNIVVGFP